MPLIYNIIFSIFLFPIAQQVDICDCARIENWRTATVKEYEFVKDVFIGDVRKISNDKSEYELIISEVFKGTVEVGATIKGINLKYCGPVVDKKGQWLFFGTITEYFHINECGLTSNLEEPWRILPPPPPPELRLDEKK